MSDTSVSSYDSEHELDHWHKSLQRIKGNDPYKKTIAPGPWESEVNGCVQNMTDEEWRELGQIISNNTHLQIIKFGYGLMNNHNISFFFQGLKRSSSIRTLDLERNELTSTGLRSVVPFLQNTNNLKFLNLSHNNIQSEGFNMMLRALRDSPIKEIAVHNCNIHSMEIDEEQLPGHLRILTISDNSINADGCRELAKLLRGGEATIAYMSLDNNNLDDNGVEIIVDALQENTSLRVLRVRGNHYISDRGITMLLKLVNDISSIEATLQSNHTLKVLEVDDDGYQELIETSLGVWYIYEALRNANNVEAAGRAKVIQTQLHSEIRAKLAALQGESRSVYSDIDPLHLPEVLALVHGNHGKGELYIALKSVFENLMSTVDRKKCIRQKMKYYEKKMKELEMELAAMEAAEGGAVSEDTKPTSTKRSPSPQPLPQQDVLADTAEMAGMATPTPSSMIDKAATTPPLPDIPALLSDETFSSYLRLVCISCCDEERLLWPALVFKRGDYFMQQLNNRLELREKRRIILHIHHMPKIPREEVSGELSYVYLIGDLPDYCTQQKFFQIDTNRWEIVPYVGNNEELLSMTETSPHLKRAVQWANKRIGKVNEDNEKVVTAIQTQGT